MGATFSFSSGRKYDKGVSCSRLMSDSLLRGIRLTFFAIFIRHMSPPSFASPQDTRAWLLAMLAFVWLVPMFLRVPAQMPRWLRTGVELATYAVGITLLLSVDYARERIFNLSYGNLIIRVLAHMAIFGSLMYLFTLRNRLACIGILPFVMAVFQGSHTEGSWVGELFHCSPLP